MDSWEDYVAAVGSALSRLAITDKRGQSLGAADGFRRWVELTHDVHGRGQNIYLVGNGASAAMASHFAADACKNGGLRAQAFNDAALLTVRRQRSRVRSGLCAAARPLRPGGRHADRDQQLRRSPNIVRALERARDMELKIVTVSGKGADNPSRSFGDVNVYVPSARYGWVESGHHVILHYWLDQYLGLHGQGAV